MNDYILPRIDSTQQTEDEFDRILNQPGFAGEYPVEPPSYTRVKNGVEIRCEHCNGVITEPLQEAALVWYPKPTSDYVIYTGFHITHKSSACIDRLFKGAAHAYWMPFTVFFKDGFLSFEWFLKPRYDDVGYLIDPDLKIDMKSLERITTPMALLGKPFDETYFKTHPRASSSVSTAGYVYLLQSPTSAYKIGRTANPKNRLQTFNVKLPFEVDYLAVIKTPNMYQLEVDLHNKFASKRINGEWFTLSPADVEYIKGLAR